MIKYYFSNAPADTLLMEFVRMSGMRWPIETALEEAKGEVGLDHYACTHRQVRCETRTWQGWHHHMLQSFLAHLFLMRLRLLFQKKALPSRPHKPVNWWWLPWKMRPNPGPISWLSYTIANAVIMPPIVLTANEPVCDHTVKARTAVNPKSRSTNRNLVVR